jgi:hypothetical protein
VNDIEERTAQSGDQQEAAMNFSTTLRIGISAVVLAASLISFTAPSSAEIATAEQRAACTPDAFRLCSSEIPNIPSITACMKKNFNNLSPACKAVFPK